MTVRGRRVVLGGLLASVVLCLIALHTRPVEDRVGGILLDLLRRRVEGNLDFARLSYHLFQGELTIDDLRFEPRSKRGGQLGILRRVTARRVRITWRPLLQLRIEASGPVALLCSSAKQDVEASGSTPEIPGSLSLPAWLDAVEIVDGELHDRDCGTRGRPERLVLAPMSAHLARNGSGEIAGSLDIRGGFFDGGSRRIEIRRTVAKGQTRGPGARLEEAELVTDLGTARARGEIHAFHPFTGSFHFDFDVNSGPLSRRLLDLASNEESPVEGDWKGRAEVSVDEGKGLQGRGTLEAPALILEPVGPVRADARWTIEHDNLKGSLLLRRGAARFEADVRGDLKGRHQSYDLELEAPSLNGLVSSASQRELPWDARIGMKITAETSRFRPETLEGRGRVSFENADGGKEDSGLGGSLRLEAAPGWVEASTEGLSFPGGRLEGRARVSNFSDLSASYRIDVARLETTLRSLGYESPLEGEVHATGTVRRPSEGALAAELRIERVPLRFEGAMRASALLQGRVALSAPKDSLRRNGFRRWVGSRLSGELEASELQWNDASLPALGGHWQTTGDELVSRIVLLPSNETLLTATVREAEGLPVEAELDLGSLPWERLLRAFPEYVPEAAKSVAFTGRALAEGPLAAPSRLTMAAEVESGSLRLSTPGTAKERVLSTRSFRTRLSEQRLTLTDFVLVDDGREIHLSGALPLDVEGRMDLTLQGDVALDLAELRYRGVSAEGTAHLDLRAAGSRAAPRLSGSVSIDGGRIEKAGRSLDNLEARLTASGGSIDIDSFRADVLGGSLSAEGRLPVPHVKSAEGATTTAVTFDLSNVDFGSAFAASESGATSLSLDGKVTFRDGDLGRPRASGIVEEVLLAAPGTVVSLSEPAEWSFDETTGLDLPGLHLEGEETDLEIDLSGLAGEGPGSPFSVSMAGTMDLAAMNLFLPESAFVSGKLSVHGVAKAREEGLDGSGSATLSDGELVLTRPPFVVQDVSAALALQGDEIVVKNLEGHAGQAGGGTAGSLEGSGTLALSATPSASFDLEVQGIRLEYPEGLKSELSASLRLEGGSGSDRYRLSGRVAVEQAMYEREISVERQLLDALRRERLELQGEPGIGSRIDLDLDVGTKRELIVNNNLGRMRVNADVVVTGTLASPEVSGTLRADPGGQLAFGGNDFELETARLSLTSYPLETPNVEIRARTEVGGEDIVLEISGPTDNLRTSMESPTDPSLSRADAVSLLLTGRKLDDVRGQEQKVVGEQLAEYLSGSVASLTEQGLSSVVPVSRIKVEPSIVGRETDPAVRFSVGESITDDLFVTYSIGLDDAEQQLWIVDYDLPYRMKLRAIRDDTNDYTAGLSQDLLFDLYSRRRPKRPEPPEPAVISRVEIRGLPPASMTEVRKQLDLEAKDGYDYWKARDDGLRIERLLRGRGFLDARAVVITVPEEPVPGQPVRLVYDVEPGPLVRITWSRDAVDEDLRRWVRESFDGYLPLRVQASRLARDLRFRLMSRRYYEAEVGAEVEEKDTEVVVDFAVSRGPRGEQVELRFEGNRALSDETLLRILPDPTSPELFEVLYARPERLKDNLELLYSERGYVDARATPRDPRFDPSSSRLLVVIRIEEGTLFEIGRLELEGAASVPESELRAVLRLKEGAVFRLGTLASDRRRLASYYRRQGFDEVTVASDLKRDGHRIDVRFRIEEGERVTVGEVRIEGAKATRESLIRDQVTFQPGEPLRLTDLTETESRLYDLEIFRSVDVRGVASVGGGPRDVVIDVTELPDLRVGYGLRYDTEEGLELMGDATFPNLLGTARHVGLNAFVSGRQKILRANLAMPSFFGLDLDTSFYLSREREKTTDFTSDAWSATFQQGRPLASRLRAQWSLGYRRSAVTENVSSGPFAFDVEARRTVLSFSLIEDTRDRLGRPSRGHFWNTTVQYAPSFLGSDLRFVKLFGQFFYFHPLGRGMVWASSYRAGIATAFDQVLLPEDRFRAGGPSSVRGFPVNGLGPEDPLTGTVLGGEGLVVLNQELRVPLFWRLGGLAFYDAGNVYLQASDFDPRDLRHSLGLGLSVDLPVGLVTLDWARVLNPPESGDRSRFHFSFGYAF